MPTGGEVTPLEIAGSGRVTSTERTEWGYEARRLIGAAPVTPTRYLQITLGGSMKYLCLAYGDGKDWEVLSEAQQAELLAKDQKLMDRGDFVTALEPTGTVVKAWDGVPTRSPMPFAQSTLPLVGFSIIEAESIEQVVDLVADTPCARAKGAIEIRPLLM